MRLFAHALGDHFRRFAAHVDEDQITTLRSQVRLDDEKKAAMVSNLLVVLCGDRSAQPVVNTGTLYQ